MMYSLLYSLDNDTNDIHVKKCLLFGSGVKNNCKLDCNYVSSENGTGSWSGKYKNSRVPSGTFCGDPINQSAHMLKSHEIVAPNFATP